MMNILHIIDSGGLYGAEMMLLSLVHEQKRMGLNPYIVSIGEKGVKEKLFETEAISRGYKLKKIRMKSGPDFIVIFDILKYSKTKKIDLFHSHGYKGNILIGMIPKWIRKKPIISTLHGYTSKPGFQLNKLRIYELIDRFSHRFINQMVIVDDALRKHPLIVKYQKTYKTINNGIMLHDFAEQGVQNDVIKEFCSGFTIGSIGRLSEEKNFIELIKAIAILLKKNINVKLIIFGEGGKRDELANKINELQLSNNVLLPGYFKKAKQLMPLFDIYVIPSLTEGLPITLLEAMSFKIPIAATKVGGIPDVLMNGKAGTFIKSSSCSDIADTILIMIENKKQTKQKTETAYKNLLENYSSHTMAEKYLSLYKNTIAHGQN